MNDKSLRGQHAIKLFVSTELKTKLDGLAKSLDRPLADVCRTLMWMGIPLLEGFTESERRGLMICTQRQEKDDHK